MRNRVEVLLRVSGDRSLVDRFAANVGLDSAFVTYRKPEHADAGLPEAWWAVVVKLVDQSSYDEGFHALERTVGPLVPALQAQLVEGLECEIDCTGIGDLEGLILCAPAGTVRLAAAIGASISFDLY